MPECDGLSMNITVILCTYNRFQSLANTLGCVALSTLPESVEWEVLVVDNNSNDQTREVVEGFCDKYPGRFRYLFEPLQGLSIARNAGIREAEGNVLAFIDDDVTVESTWLQNLTEPLHGSEWVGIGGRVLPEGTYSRPPWLGLEERYSLAPLAVFDLGAEARELTEPPFGANMAYRKEMFQKYGGFRTDLGRCAHSLLSNEDTEFGDRLIAGGERLRYEPSAVVYHPVPNNRLQKEYFLTWWFDKARADIRQFGIPYDTRWFVTGIPLYMFRRLAVWIVRWMVAVEPSRRFSNKIKAWTVAGQILECYRQPRGHGSNAA
jgi:glycosyltransferase involved in cell wall biosynthesis